MAHINSGMPGACNCILHKVANRTCQRHVLRIGGPELHKPHSWVDISMGLCWILVGVGLWTPLLYMVWHELQIRDPIEGPMD